VIDVGYSVIAIEREYASGGLEVGTRLAEKLGVPCHSHEILAKAATELGVTPEQVAHVEENITGSLLYSIAAFANAAAGYGSDSLSLEQKLALIEEKVIREFAASPCVIVGRGACALLKDRANTLSAFIHADDKTRTERAVNLYGADPKKVESVLRQQDKRRATYFRATTQMEWKDADIYDLFLNTGRLGVEHTVEILYSVYKK